MVAIVDTGTDIIIQMTGSDAIDGRTLLGLVGQQAATKLVADLLKSQLAAVYQKKARKVMDDYQTLPSPDQDQVDTLITNLKAANS